MTFYTTSPTRRGYYPRGPYYGQDGYGYGNKPAIVHVLTPICDCESEPEPYSENYSSSDSDDE